MNRGLTLVEVAVSLAVLFLGVFSLVQQWSTGARAIVVTMNSTEAAMVAERAIERLQCLPYSELRPGAGLWQTEGRFRYAVQIVPAFTNAMEVRVRVRWTEMGRPLTYAMATIIAKDYP